MTSSLEKILMEMSLEDKEEPFDLPDLPEFDSKDINSMSLIGRILNPESQKMSSLILDMPRKWQIYERVRGVALSQERFQFIFKYEHDLDDILNKGVHTYNQWALAMDKWIENPLEDFLRFIPIWVQLRNIPVNHYTPAAIRTLAGFAGPVMELDFDQSKPQNKDFVRARIRFDVTKPLRRSKIINLPSGETTSILYDYERIQKRCYFCQRLTHERDHCPLYLQHQQVLKEIGKTPASSSLPIPSLVAPSGAVSATSPSRIRIDPKALQDLHQILVGSVNPMQLTAESSARIKGKGFAEDLDKDFGQQNKLVTRDKKDTFPSSDVPFGPALSSLSLPDLLNYKESDSFSQSGYCFNNGVATRESFFSEASTSTKTYSRKKPYKPRRNLKGTSTPLPLKNIELDKSFGKAIQHKRKNLTESGSAVKVAKVSNTSAVPREGLSNL